MKIDKKLKILEEQKKELQDEIETDRMLDSPYKLKKLMEYQCEIENLKLELEEELK